MEAETAAIPSESTETSEVEMTTEVVETVESPATYADGKYNSVGELEKGYTELQSTFSKKLGAFSGSPEAYEFADGSITEGNQGLADMLGEWGLENQMSNDGINGLIGKYNEYNQTKHDANIDAEFAKLGADADTRIGNARSYLEANLGVEATQALAGSMNSAASIEAIEKLIALNKSPQVAAVQGGDIVTTDKLHEMRFAIDEHGNRKMEDPKYRAKVLAAESGLLR